MCGIVAILGQYNLNTIVDCLKNLQNRGYDSAGLSYIDNDKFIFKKELNTDSIEKLLIKETSNKLFHNCISHTRWATHGGITLNNCHPHISNNKIFNLVHNGIIENYDILKKFLINNNYIFYSETDTEIIVNLIEYYYLKNKELYKETNNDKLIYISIKKALEDCTGTWGLVIQYINEPNKLYAIKKGSPLLIGKNENITIITSESSGFNNLINNYHELETDKFYIIDNLENIIYNENNVKNIFYSIKNNITTNYDLGTFKHYTLKEIYDQRNIIQKITNNGARIKNNKISLGGLYKYKEQIINCDNLVLFGCGTSYNACLYSIYHFVKLNNFKNVVAIDACNFNEYLIPKGNNCYLFVSQSGETKDLYTILEFIKGNNNYCNSITIGVINVVDSLIARNVNCGVYLNIGKEMSVASTKVFLAQSIVLILISLYLSNLENDIENYINDIRKLEYLINLELNKDITLDIKPENFKSGFILSDKTLYPIAIESALKFKEITYSHIEALSINSLKHGPLALVSDDNFINIILGNHLSATQEILARNGKIINIQLNYENIFNDLLYIIHLQRFIYLLSVNKGINPDFPRNLAKVVTV